MVTVVRRTIRVELVFEKDRFLVLSVMTLILLVMTPWRYVVIQAVMRHEVQDAV